MDECLVAMLESEANKMKINGKRFIKETHFTSWSFRRMLIVMMILMLMITVHMPLAGVYACMDNYFYNKDHHMETLQKYYGSEGGCTGTASFRLNRSSTTAFTSYLILSLHFFGILFLIEFNITEFQVP